MAKTSVKVELHNSGFQQLRTDPAVVGDLGARASRIASAAGDGMQTEMMRGRNRGRASVRTGTFAARKAQAESLALTRAIDAGR